MGFNIESNFYFPLPDVLQAIKILRDRLSGKEQLLPRLVDKPLVLYGAGNLGLMACEYLKKIKILPDAVIDKKVSIDETNSLFNGIPFLNPANMSEEVKCKSLLAICVVSASYEEIRKSLKNQGWLDIVPFYDIVESYRHIHPLSNGWFAEPFNRRDLAAIELVIEGYADDISRAHFLQFIAWRRLRQEWYFEGASIQINNRFFIPEIKSKLGNEEVFIDVGAHHGSVSERFIEEVCGKFKEITAIEPDPENILILNEYFANQENCIKEKVRVFEDFIDEKPSSRKYFVGLGYSSQFSEIGNIVVDSKTIDSLVLEPTYMKFHLEGFELAALKGSVLTISKFRPKISITAYHNPDGIYLMLLWLINNLNNYDYLFRMHGWCGTGAVIYCIPIEKK